ncbi:MAG: uroporphyrinogen-III synthase [Coriobacteriia bacterium]|nr:uroporphyrinogen-III synthase [Coriobacteriia bacterium]
MGWLAGKRVVVTRSREQAGTLVSLLEAAGAEPLVFPSIEIVDPPDTAPLDDAIRSLDVYAWVIFTSVNTVARFFARMALDDLDARHLHGLRVAAVGPATATALRSHGIEPDFVPDEYVGEGVLEGLCVRGVGAGTRVLLPRALEAREVLPDGLRERGVRVDVVPVYQTVTGPGDAAVLERLRAREADAVTFTSPSTVRGFLRLAEGVDVGAMVVATIGPVAARAAREAGLEVDVEPAEYTAPGLVSALDTYGG